MKKSKPEPVPVMDYRQYRRARRLVHECCNYDGGHCIALDDGEECVCVQSISYSLLCRWFRAAVLPLDRELETALFHRLDAKRCAVCGALFTPGSNRAKYCPECAGRMKRISSTPLMPFAELSYTMQQSTHGVTGINGGKGKYPLNISQKKSFIHFVRQTHIS